MEPVTLATITAAACVLATEAAKNFAGEAGKSLWEKVKGRLGFDSEPKPEDLPVEIARKLSSDTQATKDVLRLMKQSKSSSAASLVGRIDAEKVVVQQINTVAGDLNIHM